MRAEFGLHAGDVIREEDNVFGGAVNIASRICGLSAPGEVLVSDVVRAVLVLGFVLVSSVETLWLLYVLAFTQAAIGRMAQDGRLSLDDTIAKHLPDYPNAAAAAKITVGSSLHRGVMSSASRTARYPWAAWNDSRSRRSGREAASA